MNTTCTTLIRLTTENVTDIFNRCLYVANSHGKSSPLNVEGFENNFTFDTEALQEQKHNIEALLDQLPASFKNGWSFWEMYRTDDGHNWTTSLQSMEALMALGIAIQKIRYVLPKESWWSLPGGAPYVILNS